MQRTGPAAQSPGWLAFRFDSRGIPRAGNLSDFDDGVAQGGASIPLAVSVFRYRLLSIRQKYLRIGGVAPP